jgi:hypothetical protein
LSPKNTPKIGKKYLQVGKLVRKLRRGREIKAEEEEEEEQQQQQVSFRDLIRI